MSPYMHATRSAERFGGKWEDYYPVHEFLDMSKTHMVDFRHRALLHHTFGIYICERIFGPVLINHEGKAIETRYVVIQHIQEDLGCVPTVKDWLQQMKAEPWMYQNRLKKVNHETTLEDPAISAAV